MKLRRKTSRPITQERKLGRCLPIYRNLGIVILHLESCSDAFLSFLLFCQFGDKFLTQTNAGFEVLNGEIFVRRMDLRIGQRQP